MMVTGAGGFVGRHLSALLHAAGHDVIAVEREGGCKAPPATRPAPVSNEPSIAELADLIGRERPRVVFHLAGVTGPVDGRLVQQANVAYADRVLTAVARVNAGCTVVLIGSAAEYGRPQRPDGVVNEEDTCRPVSTYGISKLAQTDLGMAAAASGLPVVVARLFNPVGEGSAATSAAGSFVRQLADMAPGGGQLTTGPLGAVRDLMDVRWAAHVLAQLPSCPGATGRIVNVCSGVGTPMHRLVERLIALVPFPVRHVVDRTRGGTSDVDVVVGDASRLADLGLRPAPVDLDPILIRMLESAGVRPTAVP